MKANNLDGLEIAEYLSLIGAVVGSVAAVISQQVIYAAVPLSLSLLLNLFNRYRWEQVSRQSLASLISQLDQKLASVKNLTEERVDALREDIAHLNQEAQKIQGSQDIKGIIAAMLQLQGQILTLEQSVQAIAAQLEYLTQTTTSQPNQPSPDIYSSRSQTSASSEIKPTTSLDPQEILKRYQW
ncbi:MAG: hypothetical protein N3E45_07005 [Oscillatoriaceae bacterium SKW80]|nr:hypothetical protein [Oscillatoriaceae bacterium SKYG93]MCX8120564.1 hypothetical protein [Oscillatoriaceae bacterium SKW80]MDW8453899.1 hypothetical protein [Oscillatoriaceae cyanobacterium SKYGB_i_bin93]HIK27128.1 hypothetical protein [Oscillatoriaceae cyanobacterium M7585_C2015_266]